MIIDVNAPAIALSKPPKKIAGPCEGFFIHLPAGISGYAVYPLYLHVDKNLLWCLQGISSDGKRITLQAIECIGRARKDGKPCKPCEEHTLGGFLPRILERMNGVKEVHESTTLPFYGFAGLLDVIKQKNGQIKTLRLGKLNIVKRLRGTLGSLEDSKWLYLAIATGKVKHITHLLKVAIKHKRGI
jgi:hypothetical protein